MSRNTSSTSDDLLPAPARFEPRTNAAASTPAGARLRAGRTKVNDRFGYSAVKNSVVMLGTSDAKYTSRTGVSALIWSTCRM